jgi:hypothetical protein
VKEADKALRVTAFFMADHHFAMATNIEKNTNLLIFTANDDHWLFTNNQSFEVPKVGDLTFVCDMVPGMRPVLIH